MNKTKGKKNIFFGYHRALSYLATATGISALCGAAYLIFLQEQQPVGRWLVYTGLLAMFICGVGISRRVGLSGWLATLPILVVAGLHQLKYSNWGTALVVTDVYYFVEQFRANLTILDRYPSLTQQLFLSIGIGLTVTLCLYFFEKPLWPQASYRHRLAWQAITLALGFSLFPVGWQILRYYNPPFFTQTNGAAWTMIVARHNVFSNFLLSINWMETRMPPRSSASLGKFPHQTKVVPQDVTLLKPNIVIWHDESLIDPSLLADCRHPACTLRLYQRDRQTVEQGLLHVPSHGGASWTAEFALFTGFNFRLFGAGGIYTHFSLAPRVRQSLPRRLRELGYRTVALYPNGRNFYNAANAFYQYGFDEFLAPEDLGLPTDPNLLTDQVMAEQAARILLEQAKQQKALAATPPIFLFISTQYQHGPHTQATEQLPEPYRSLQLSGFTDLENLNLRNYLYRAQLTDRASRLFENCFLENTGMPSLVFAHYGDHQPSFDGLMKGMKKRGMEQIPLPIQAQITSYIIKSNLPLQAKSQQPFDTRSLGTVGTYDYLDMGYLGERIVTIAGLPLNAFYQAQAMLREQCQGKYLDCQQPLLLEQYHNYVLHELAVMR